MRIVRTRSIPNVDDARLVSDLAVLHGMFHTAEGLRGHDGSRRNLFDNGVKCLRIREELTRRGVPSGICCRWCGDPHPHAAP